MALANPGEPNLRFRFLLIWLLSLIVLYNCSKPILFLYGGILVTFDTKGETYRIFITNEDIIEGVIAVQQGDSRAAILNGKLINGSVAYDKPWSCGV